MGSRLEPRLPRALIFDLDGLLLDSERIYRDTFEEACREVGWPSPDITIYSKCIGVTGPETDAILRNGYGPSFPLQSVRQAWQRRYHDQVENRPTDVKPGAVELLSYCRGREIPCGLATSTHARLTNIKLTLAGLDGYFPIRVTGDEVKRGKPDPEPYITAAERLGVSPDRCWALEDSAYGVRSALAAGCRVVQVPDLIEPTPQLLRLGHQVLGSLHDVLAELRAADTGSDPSTPNPG